MAERSVLYRVTLNVSDFNRNHFQTYRLNVEQHPSENDYRMLLRIASYALHAQEGLSFTKGLCVNDEPELWVLNDMGDPTLWIDLGLPEEKRIKQAISRAEEILVYAYGEKRSATWWSKLSSKIKQNESFNAYLFCDNDLDSWPELPRQFELQCMIQDDQLEFIGDSGQESIEIRLLN